MILGESDDEWEDIESNYSDDTAEVSMDTVDHSMEVEENVEVCFFSDSSFLVCNMLFLLLFFRIKWRIGLLNNLVNKF